MLRRSYKPERLKESRAEAQPELALEYAPRKLRAHGYSDVHSRPLVSPDRGKVTRSWRVPPDRAWNYPRVELRAANSWPGVMLDCDGPVSIECLIAATSTGELPKPNVIVQRRASGNCHVSWFLGSPVHRGELAGWKPQYALARVAEFYRQRVEADPDFTGVLTLNPMHSGHHGSFKTWWGRRDPYLLDELAEVIPFGWRLPTLKRTGIGRNVDLFQAAMRESGKPRTWGKDVTALVVGLNEALEAPLDHAEALAIAGSVNRIQRKNLDSGQTQRRFAFIQSCRGKRSGKARRERVAERDAEIVQAVAGGASMRKVAGMYGLTAGAVHYVVRRGVQ